MLIPDAAFSDQLHAPGQPGIPPTWTSSAKDMVGCAIGPSRIWFTLGFGIVNEVYYPRVDIPQIRDLGFIVADGAGFWIEVKRMENYTVRLLSPGVPAVEVIHRHERFELKLRVCPDRDRDVLAIEAVLEGDPALDLHVLLAPHLGATGSGNTAQVTRCGARRVLGAEQGPFGLALVAVDQHQQDAIGEASAGYVGVSDGWQDFNCNGAFTWRYRNAGPGNVALTARVPRRCVLGLGFGAGVQPAATLAISSLMQPFENLLGRHIHAWERWHAERSERSLILPHPDDVLAQQFLLSSMVLRTHLDKAYPGAMVASLSVPWGNSRDDRGGYHLVWPRDLVQCATALLALGAEHEARNTLRYLIATQRPDGSWSQNQWLGGTPYWTGVQLDEAAFPILLAEALSERAALGGINVEDMVVRALGFIARTGPCTEQDRWEENAGLNAFSLSVAIAALVSGASFAPEPAAMFALALADFWNARMDEWLVARGSGLAHRLGLSGCYVRVAPPQVLHDPQALTGAVQLRNRADGGLVAIDEAVSTDFLQAIRFGLRAPDDPWVLDSIRAADAVLKVDTPNGPAWRRYNGDGYGEHDDGSPFDGCGVGRLWPLLTGERGHYELVAGRDPSSLLHAMAAMTGPAGMLPEQVWDAAPVPAARLLPGQPTGAAMPLAWAHAEFIKLMMSRDLGRPVDRPEAAWRRYRGQRPKAANTVWRMGAPVASMDAGSGLLIAAPRPARLRWGVDGWRRTSDAETADTELGLHTVELPPDLIGAASRIDFTFQWLEDGRWVGRDFHVEVQRKTPTW